MKSARLIVNDLASATSSFLVYNMTAGGADDRVAPLLLADGAEELGRRVEAFWAERQEVMLACRQLYDADVLIYELDDDKDKDEEVRIIQDLRVDASVALLEKR